MEECKQQYFFRDNDAIWYVLDQPAELNFESAVLLKQYRGRYDETPYPVT
jgi:hypothetical protein